MLPDFTGNDLVNSLRSQSVLNSKLLAGSAALSVFMAYVLHLSFIEHCVATLFASPIGIVVSKTCWLTSFSTLVFVILGKSASKEMVGIYAQAIIAFMANAKMLRQWAECDLVDISMGSYPFSLKVKHSVAVLFSCPYPAVTVWPLTGRFINLFPESFQWISLYKFSSTLHRTCLRVRAVVMPIVSFKDNATLRASGFYLAVTSNAFIRISDFARLSASHAVHPPVMNNVVRAV